MKHKLTQQDVDKMKAEIEHRKVEVRPELLEHVKEARAHGDLSENFEYHAAKKEKNRNESRLLPVVHLPTHVQILIPRKRGLVIPVIWDQPKFIVYDSFGHFGLAPCFLILKCCNFLCNFIDTLITRINFYRIKYLIHLNSCNAFVHNLFRTNLICDVG